MRKVNYMRKCWLMALAAGLLAAGAAQAQDSYLTRSGDMFARPSNAISGAPGVGSLFGMLNSQNLKLSNETSFSVFSGPGGSLSQGLNVTRLTYQGGSPLSMSVGLGSLFMSSGSYLGYSAKPGFYLHDLGLKYKVGEHSLITFQYQQVQPGRYSPYDFSGLGYANDQVLPIIR